MTRSLAIDALKKAHRESGKPRGAIFHSDRGSQYASKDFRDTLDKAGFAQSMSRKGNCRGNACAESFFASLKKEEIFHRKHQSKYRAHQSLF